MTEHETTTIKQIPTCYRHPDRETWVSCGRCGKPLCPDCMVHGPVGVRCRECLLPQGKGTGLVAPARVGQALTFGAILAGGWVILLVVAALLTNIAVPNFLLSGAAGGTVGWLIWRRCGRVWNQLTVRWTVILAIVMPLLAAGVVIGLLAFIHMAGAYLTLIFAVRTVVATGISLLMAWLLVTNNA